MEHKWKITIDEKVERLFVLFARYLIMDFYVSASAEFC